LGKEPTVTIISLSRNFGVNTVFTPKTEFTWVNIGDSLKFDTWRLGDCFPSSNLFTVSTGGLEIVVKHGHVSWEGWIDEFTVNHVARDKLSFKSFRFLVYHSVVVVVTRGTSSGVVSNGHGTS
tara:strand:- start:220 stop:588 length:369 start_codon:yes stop_codon:yes gene_type:complete